MATLVRRALAEVRTVLVVLVIPGDVLAQLVGRRTCDQEVAGSTPSRGARLRDDSGQVVYIPLPLPQNSIIWYRSMGGDALRLGR